MASTSTPSSAPSPPKNKTYKEQLDEAAIKARSPQDDQTQGGIVNTVVEKVSQYVPAVGNALGQGQKDGTPAQPEDHVADPPKRPHHDPQIAEFVRDQHRSKTDLDEATAN